MLKFTRQQQIGLLLLLFCLLVVALYRYATLPK